MLEINKEEKDSGRPVDVSKIKQFLSEGEDVNAKDSFGLTALMQASEHEQAEVVKLLLSAGAEVNVKDKEGKTALHHCAATSNTEVAKLLISAGADGNAKDNQGMTALDVAWLWEGFRRPIVVALGG